jgi:hypothetical protein
VSERCNYRTAFHTERVPRGCTRDEGRNIRKFPGDGAVIDKENLSAFVSPFIPAIVFSQWKDNMPHTYQSEENFLAGHVFGGAVCLEPSPVMAKDFGDAFSIFALVFIDYPLNHGDVGLRNGLSAYDDGYHGECIS